MGGSRHRNLNKQIGVSLRMRAPSGATEEPKGDFDVVRSSDLRGHRLRRRACGA